MPADRIITVRRFPEATFNDAGIYQPGTPVEHRVWATKKDLTLEEIVDGGGARASYEVEWRIQIQRRDLRNEHTVALDVIWTATLRFNVVNSIEITEQSGAVGQTCGGAGFCLQGKAILQ